MSKIIGKLLLSVVLFVALFFSQGNKVYAQNSYELFWPIVAGRTSGDPLYSLKVLKEKVRGALVFSDVKKVEYYLFLSEKRLVEFESLAKVKKDIENSGKTLDMLRENHSKVIDYFNKAKAGNSEVRYINQRILNSFGNQTLVLEGMLDGLESGLKNSVLAMISFLKSESEKLH